MNLEPGSFSQLQPYQKAVNEAGERVYSDSMSCAAVEEDEQYAFADVLDMCLVTVMKLLFHCRIMK